MQLTLNIDGGSRGNPGPAGAGVVVRDDRGRALFEGGFFLGEMTNNAAEYNGLLHGLRIAAGWPDADLVIISDSELMVRQVTGEYRVRSPDLAPLFEQAQRQLLRRGQWQIRHVRREHNIRADDLANRAMDAGADVIITDARPPAGATNATRSTPTADKARPPVQTARSRDTAAGGNGRRPAPAGSGSTPAAPGAGRVVNARCTIPAARGACPAGCARGQVFAFGDGPPADLCLDALAAMLNTVLALRDAPLGEDESVPALTIRCFRPGCGGVFELYCEG